MTEETDDNRLHRLRSRTYRSHRRIPAHKFEHFGSLSDDKESIADNHLLAHQWSQEAVELYQSYGISTVSAESLEHAAFLALQKLDKMIAGSGEPKERRLLLQKKGHEHLYTLIDDMAWGGAASFVQEYDSIMRSSEKPSEYGVAAQVIWGSMKELAKALDVDLRLRPKGDRHPRINFIVSEGKQIP